MITIAAALMAVQVSAAQTGPVSIDPDLVRDSIADLVRNTPPGQPLPVGAHDLARTLAASVGDDFTMRRLLTIDGWSRQARAQFLTVDSLMAAGREAFREGSPGEALSIWRQALAIAERIPDPALSAGVGGNMGSAFYALGWLDSATVYFERSRDSARQTGDWRTAGNATVMLGNLMWDRGDRLRAMRTFESALEVHRSAGDHRGMAADHNNMALLAEELGDYDLASEHLGIAVALGSESDDPQRGDYLYNLAGLRASSGDPDRAMSLYRRASDDYQARGEDLNAAHAWLGISRVHSVVSRYADALTAIDSAMTLADGIDDATLADAHRQAASVQAAIGNFTEADRHLRAARSHAEAEGVPELRAGVALVAGDLAMYLNDFETAASEYAAAEREFSAAGEISMRIQAIHAIAAVDFLRGDPAGVVRRVQAIPGTLEGLGAQREANWTRLLLARAFIDLNQTEEAAAVLQKAGDYFERVGERAGLASQLIQSGRLERLSGRLANATQRLARARELSEDLPSVSFEARVELARTLASNGLVEEAIDVYGEVVDDVESEASAIAVDFTRASFLGDKWSVYSELSNLLASESNAAAAFTVSERMRTPSPASWERDGGESDSRVGPLRDRINYLSRQLDRTANPLVRGGERAGDAAHISELLLEAQSEFAALGKTSRVGRSIAMPTVAEVTATLHPTQAVVSYVVGPEGTTALVLRSDTVASIALPVRRTELRHMVSFAREVMVPDTDRDRELWRESLFRLAAVIWRPLDETGLLDGISDLVIVPHVELTYLPFEALPVGDGSGVLGERYSVAYTTAVSNWIQKAPVKGRGAEAGVAVVAPLTSELPGTLHEVRYLSEIFPSSRVLVDDAADEASVLDMIGRAGIVHLATRGGLNRLRPEFSYIQLGGEANDRLEVHEVASLDLSAELVVLSACETALGAGTLFDVAEGDDWVGLVRAFARAGARNVVASLWQVDDLVTAELMRHFYRGIVAGLPYADALARAKTLIRANPTTSNPYYWAGFVIYQTVNPQEYRG